MKIAFVAETFGGPGYWGGISRYTLDLGLALAEQGHEIHVYTMADHDALQLGRECPFTVHSVPAYRPRWIGYRSVYWKLFRPLFPGYCFINEWAMPLARRVLKDAQAGVFDLIEAPETGARLGYALVRGLARQVPVVARLHSPSFITSHDYFRQDSRHLRQMGQLERHFVRQAQAVSSPSRSVAQVVSREFDLGDRHIQVIAHPVTLPQISRAAPSGERRVVFVGRLEELKGFDTLMKALPAILRVFPDTRFDLVGPDTLQIFKRGIRNGIKAYVGEDWADRAAAAIHWHGHLPPYEADRIRAQGACVVVPSLYESFGYALTEALSLGCPVVASRTGGLAEIVTHERNGLLVPVCHAEELAAAVLRLLSHPDQAAALGRQARRDMAEHYAPQRIARTMADWYYGVRDAWLGERAAPLRALG